MDEHEAEELKPGLSRVRKMLLQSAPQHGLPALPFSIQLCAGTRSFSYEQALDTATRFQTSEASQVDTFQPETTTLHFCMFFLLLNHGLALLNASLRGAGRAVPLGSRTAALRVLGLRLSTLHATPPRPSRPPAGCSCWPRDVAGSVRGARLPLLVEGQWANGYASLTTKSQAS